MAEEETAPQRQHIAENFKPEVLRKNFVPTTAKPGPGPATGHGVEGNYVPPTSEKPSSPPPMPKK
jgi:hypothetical protein